VAHPHGAWNRNQDVSWSEGAYRDAHVLARARATSVGGLGQAGVEVRGAGKVRLLRPAGYPGECPPTTTPGSLWEALHQLIRVFCKDGESGADLIHASMRDKTEFIWQLAYRLYILSERRGWAEDVRGYNEPVTSWPAIEMAACTVPKRLATKQLSLLGGSR
jgi:putative DNA methylase